MTNQTVIQRVTEIESVTDTTSIFTQTRSSLFTHQPNCTVLAENVSATANPIANSSGSVTNQAIQVLQGPYITNTYGNGIQCQGPVRLTLHHIFSIVTHGKILLRDITWNHNIIWVTIQDVKLNS